jgi:predicted nuclease with TOPRIM domain
MEEKIIQQVAEHEVRIDKLEENQKELKHRVEDIHKIATSVELIATNVDHMKGDVSELKEGQAELKEDLRNSQQELKDRIKDVEDAPAKKTASTWDSIKDKILWLFVGGVVAFILTQLLPDIFSK